MQIEFITKNDLERFKNELISEIKQILEAKSSIHSKEWLKSPEVMKLLDISPGTLQNLRINGTLKFSKVGGTIYYKSEDIQRMIETGGAK